MLPLFARFPALEPKLPVLPIGDYPTPVEPLRELGSALQLPRLYVKRDDLTGQLYGGNKIRKLEFLLGAATRGGAGQLLTLGFAGSNHALATAICAQAAGLSSISLLLHQANAAYVRRNLLLGHHFGAELHAVGSVPAAVAQVVWTMLRHGLASGRLPRYVPPGGSSTVGTCGYVNAALELANQVAAGVLPEPDRIYVPLGSMGTAAGLALGLKVAGLNSRVIAVRVVDTQFGDEPKLRRLIDRTAAFLHGLAPAFPRIRSEQCNVEVRDGYFGEGYGVFTDAAREAATEVLKRHGLKIDGTYSGKALAALFDDARSATANDRVVLFWSTSNSRDLSAQIAGADYRELPPAFHRYFTGDCQRWVGES